MFVYLSNNVHWARNFYHTNTQHQQNYNGNYSKQSINQSITLSTNVTIDQTENSIVTELQFQTDKNI